MSGELEAELVLELELGGEGGGTADRELSIASVSARACAVRRRATALYCFEFTVRVMLNGFSEGEPEARFRSSGAKPGAYMRGAGRPMVSCPGESGGRREVGVRYDL